MKGVIGEAVSLPELDGNLEQNKSIVQSRKWMIDGK